MFEVIKSEYGKNIGEFEFDYFGDYTGFDIVIINAKIKFYEKGLLILAELSEESLFIEWDRITGIAFTKDKKALVNITTDKGIIKLKKEKKETDVSEFKNLLRNMVKDIEIEYIKLDSNNISLLEMKRQEKNILDREKRIEDFVENYKCKNDEDIDECWCNHLKENLQFPFEAEIIEEPDPLDLGDIIKVISIEGVFDLEGIVVKVRKGRKQYSFPLCLLELIEKNSNNYELVEDYNYWFCNR